MTPTVPPRLQWIIDGNNVMGARPDGWWNDRRAAAARLAAEVERWATRAAEQVVLVFDGWAQPSVADLERPGFEVRFAGTGRDAADDLVVAVARRLDLRGVAVRVVTADRGLRARLPAGAEVEGPGAFLDRMGR